MYTLCSWRGQLLWECEVAKNFWNLVCNWIKSKHSPFIQYWNYRTVGNSWNGRKFCTRPSDGFNYLTCKILHISKLRDTVPSVQGFNCIVKQKYATEVCKVTVRMRMKQKNVGKNTSLWQCENITNDNSEVDNDNGHSVQRSFFGTECVSV